MSTARSDEELLHPRVTLSYALPSLSLGLPDVAILALNIGSNGLSYRDTQGGVTNLGR